MAQVKLIDIVAPGRKGLNTEAKNTLLDPGWATEALNAVVNRAGRIGNRSGWTNQTTNAIAGTPKIDVMFEYLNEAGTSTIISVAANKIYKDVDDFTDAGNAITSTTAPTADHWQFVNFNGFVIGVQKGHAPIQWAGSGVFTDISFTGTGYDGNCICAAFGRVWAADADLQTVRFSSLLDHDDMSTTGGTIDMSSIWTLGMDRITAIAAVGSNLVVFGKNHIVIWADGSGSSIGLNPTRLEVVDIIEGTGCIARDSVQVTGSGDLIFLSRHGIQSLARVIASKSNPLVTLSKHVRTDLKGVLAAEIAADAQLDAVRSTYIPEEGLYILHFPTGDVQYVLDFQHPFQDDDGEVMYPVTKWEISGSIGALLTTIGGVTYLGSSGIVGKYTGSIDNATDINFQFFTGWLDFGDELNHVLKLAKDLIGTVAIGGNTTVSWKWEFDFDGNTKTRTVTHSGLSQAEFNIAEFNIGEFAGAVTVQRKYIPMYGEGQFMRLGVSASLSSFNLIVQQLSFAVKLGRMIN